MSAAGPKGEWRDEADSLRRFGMALACDDQWAEDQRSAAALVETLISRTLVARCEDHGPGELDRRSRLLGLFVRLYRRHVRLRRVQEDGDAPEGAPMVAGLIEGRELAVQRAMRSMPFELREAILLVALERLSHVEAAAALEIPLAALLERLARARSILAQQMAPKQPFAALRWAPHLRVVK